MSNYTPPPVTSNFSMQPRGNGFAVASLVFSLIGFCVPVVGGLIGVILGFLGLKRAKETASGQGMAVAGIVIGLITLLGYGATGFGFYKLYAYTKPARDQGRQFVTDLSKGDLDAATKDSSGIKAEELSADIATLKPLGALTDTTSSSTNVVNNTCTLLGVATFANGTKAYTINLVHANGGWKVTSASFQ